MTVDKSRVTTFDTWLLNCYNHSPTNDKDYTLTWISLLCWTIWKSRCLYVYQHQEVSPIVTLKATRNLTYEFLHATDASWYPPNQAGIGCVIRDSNRVLIAGTSYRESCGSVTEAETSAILAGAELAASLQLQDVIIESDSEEVILELKKKHGKVNWRTYLIIQQIRRKCSSFDSCIWVWIPREANRVAHGAASLAFGSVNPMRWASQPPPSLTNVLRNDGLPSPPMVTD
ncbi:hypothetical protein ACLB2K_036663 [Fragaria x ananassa]